ncbi:MAG TPA: gliding motility-associated C-terminal domain-containing protein [Sediminibacterium sp.]|nr:gliding motility-associated C-terminal domain-containing protein [Sediminibacterium sp.]
MRYGWILCLGICFCSKSWGQSCTTLGQNPYTAFPVCGTKVFSQSSVPACGGRSLPTPCGNDGAAYGDLNPFWYKFTCYTTGTLGFIITPNNLGDDYDWQLFDITGRNPADVYTDKSLIVSANWSGSYGVTGASPAGQHAYECASLPEQGIPTFSTMPTILAGHDYLLLVSHFTSTNQSGYTLSFPSGAQGGTASIVNPVVPEVSNAYGICDGTAIMLKLNKTVNCNSIAADGSDFSVSGPVPVSIASATGNNCSNGFDSDSILLKLNTVLAPGTYNIIAKNGTDGNTVVDNCANSLAAGTVATIKFVPATPTPMDSIVPVVCATDTLQLVFSKPMQCSSIAADGSDFRITGPAPVAISKAFGICSNGVSTVISLVLSAPIRTNGNFTILLQNGSDGNTLVDECSEVTPAGSTLTFTTQYITTADFQSIVSPGCKKDTLTLSHNGYGGTTNWVWSLDSAVISTQQNTQFISNAFGTYLVRLQVSNGVCSDAATSQVVLPDNTIRAGFSVTDTLCPGDTLHFTDRSSANAVGWEWHFGNGFVSYQQAPAAQYYPTGNRRSNFTAWLAVKNNLGCADTAFHIIAQFPNCYIAVPSAFTPNGDGLNDYLYPLNAFKAVSLIFRVYNRYGQVVFETRDPSKKWDGSINGQAQPSGTFVWTLEYTDRDTGQKVFQKGTTVLIR